MAPRFWLAVLVVSGVLVRPAHNFVAPPPGGGGRPRCCGRLRRAPPPRPPRFATCALRGYRGGIRGGGADDGGPPRCRRRCGREVITIERAPKMGVLRKLWAVKRTLYI